MSALLQMDQEVHVFPEKDDMKITSVALTEDFLIYCTDKGSFVAGV